MERPTIEAVLVAKVVVAVVAVVTDSKPGLLLGPYLLFTCAYVLELQERNLHLLQLEDIRPCFAPPTTCQFE